jgi:hypothetical protein
VPVLFFIGSLLMQTAWLLTIPPFRGLDEFDHSYRAAAVARGEWRPTPQAPLDGRGELVTVPRDLVEAASPICDAMPYTGADNCYPVTDEGDGLVTVASAASRYNPFFYWTVGTAARPFDGYAALYVMRVATMALCSLFIALAGWSVTCWAKTPWPARSIVLAMSPVAVYSTSVAAPNGVEICAALALWCILAGLTTTGLHTQTQRALILATAPCAATLATVRLFGIVWLAVIVACFALISGVQGCRGLIRNHRWTFLIAVLSAGAAVSAALYWISISPQSVSEGNVRFPNPVENSLRQIPLWILQSIAAFPARGDAAPAIVYVLGLMLFGAFVVAGVRMSTSRLRVALVACIVLSLAIPLASTMATYSGAGAIWQGRYSLPISVGIVVLAGLALEQRHFKFSHGQFVLPLSWVALLVMNAVGALAVLLGENAASALRDSQAWLTHPAWLVFGLMALGWIAWGVAAGVLPAATSQPRKRAGDEHSSTTPSAASASTHA